MISVVKLKSILIIFCSLLIVMALSYGIVESAKAREIPKPSYTIVLDAGHGGRDNGVTGSMGTKESELNLKITKLLMRQLENFGFDVVLTRRDEKGLYKKNVDNFKKDDMEARNEIIQKANPHLVISIHCNAYSDKSVHGAQVYCLEKDSTSETFAFAIQKELKKILPDNSRESIGYGDYYMLKCENAPSVIVECGYLSNVEEERLLNMEEHQEKLTYAILCGIMRYFGVCEIMTTTREYNL